MVECKECNLKFKTGRSYSNHIRWKHLKVEYKKIQCNFCNINFRKENIDKHISVCKCNPDNFKYCKQCNKVVIGYRQQFCNQSCSGRYNNTHKSHGTRRSKLEVWLEEKLKLTFPTLDIHFNKKDAIESELDIFIPKLRIAFELNGIYHYKSIHGPALLQRIQNNDLLKQNACNKNNIILYSIDTSSLSTFNEKAAIPFFEEIINKINA